MAHDVMRVVYYCMHAFCAMQAYTKFKTTKIYYKGEVLNYTKIYTNGNFLLYGNMIISFVQCVCPDIIHIISEH